MDTSEFKLVTAVSGAAKLRVYMFTAGLCVCTTAVTKMSISSTRCSWSHACVTYRKRIEGLYTQAISTKRSKFTHGVGCSIFVGDMDEGCNSDTRTSLSRTRA